MIRFVAFSSFFLVVFAGAVSQGAFKVDPTVMIGTGVLIERNNDNLTDSTRLPLSFGAGARVDRWQARIEYSSYRTTDGNQTVSVSRVHEVLIGWGAYEFGSIDGWSPYAATALGSGRTSVESRVSGATDAAKGNWDGMFAVALGLRADWTKHFSVRPEIRYESAESFKTKDARMGVSIQADYVF